MTGKTIGLLATASLLALAIATPASAQDTQPPQDKANEASPSDIIVTGFRASLGSAQALKRSSDSIVDAIVSEDIGKLPDNNAAEALARITGVQVLRYNDEAGDVLVRGLPNVTTTYNGRELFSADDRQLHFQDFAASVAAGLEVYKSGTADLIEPGLAGLINIRSRRPFDVKDLTIAGEIRGTYNDQSKSADPAGNLLLTKRWNTSIGEIGALINVSWVRGTYRNADRFDDGNPITPAGYNVSDPSDDLKVTTPGVGQFHFPNMVGNYYSKGTRYRPSVNGAVQWRPTDNLEFYVEGLWSAYRGVETIDFFGVDLGRVGLDGTAGTLSNVVLVPGQDGKAASLTKTGGFSPTFNRSAQNDRLDTYQGAGGFKWTTGRATLTGDFGYTKSKYEASEYRVDGYYSSVPTVNVDFDVKGSAVFDLGNFDAGNPASALWNGYYQRHFVAQGDGYQGRLDLDLETDSIWLPKLQFGFRATTRTSQINNGDRYASTTALAIPLASLPTGGLEMVTDGWRGDPQRFRNWLEPTRASIRANGDAMRLAALSALQQLSAANPTDQNLRNSIAQFSTQDVQDNPSADYHADERTYAAYAQARYKFDLGGIRIDGLAGVRIVNEDGREYGMSRVVDPLGNVTYVPRSAGQNYVDVLPSFQSKIHFTDQLQLRLAYTKTRTRPGFGDLNPSLNITTATGTGSSKYNGYASSGNPDLKPLTSQNYDASLEYYFKKNGFVSAAFFYHDLWGFFNTYTRDQIDPVYGLIQLSRPENAGKGRIMGVEASAQTFFDFLPGWLSGFGAQANVTYLDGTNALPSTPGDRLRTSRSPTSLNGRTI
jgi:TonB-dependent receptor